MRISDNSFSWRAPHPPLLPYSHQKPRISLMHLEVGVQVQIRNLLFYEALNSRLLTVGLTIGLYFSFVIGTRMRAQRVQSHANFGRAD